MSKEQFVNNTGLWLDKMRLLQNSRLLGQNITIAGINNEEKIMSSTMSGSDYEKEWVAPGWASIIENITKSSTFTTDVSGTYESETLDLTETLNSVENNYGA